jgi:hypothetical protein
VTALVKKSSTKEAAERYSETRQKFIELKTDLVNKLGEVSPFIETILTACAAFSSSPKITIAVEIAKFVKVSSIFTFIFYPYPLPPIVIC